MGLVIHKLPPGELSGHSEQTKQDKLGGNKEPAQKNPVKTVWNIKRIYYTQISTHL